MIEKRATALGVTAAGGTMHGLVTPFGTPTVIGDLTRDGFREQIAPGAFTKTLQERDVVALWNHDSSKPLARTSAGNLHLRQTERGLEADITPVETSYGNDLRALAEAGVVKGMSFGFEIVDDDWTDDEGRSVSRAVGTNRTIREVRLVEVSAVTFPAYPTTDFAARDARESSAQEAREDDQAPDLALLAAAFTVLAAI